MKKEEKQVKTYNKLIEFLDINIFNNKNLCFGVVYSNFKTNLIDEEDFLFIITHYFLNNIEF